MTPELEPESSRIQRAGYASPEDYALCARLHRKHGTTYYFATQRFRPEFRQRTHAVYGFVRVADEWVDNPGDMSISERAAKLADFRQQFLAGLDGKRPDDPVMRAFCDVSMACSIPVEEPMLFLDAMEMDLDRQRYPTYRDLRDYMRGSAVAVGLMMVYVLGAKPEPRIIHGAECLGEAMQLTNFLRDIGDDRGRGRIYLPLEELAAHGVTEEAILGGVIDDRFRSLMKFQISRARALYAESDAAIPLLPREAQKPVLLARILYSRILDRIESRGYDVFSGRARTSRLEKLRVAAQIFSQR